MSSKENKISQKLYDHLLDNQKQLTNYLTYIRQKQPPSKITLDTSLKSIKKNNPKSVKVSKFQSKHNSLKQNGSLGNKSAQIILYVQKYVKTLKEVAALQSSSSKKIEKKTLQFLQEFPSMNFLYEVINSFGKDQKKLTHNQSVILSYATDQMIPLFQKIIEKIQQLRKQSQGKKLLQLGHRIQHLQDMVNNAKLPGYKNNQKNQEMNRIFEKFEADRIEKYLVMQDNILKAQKRFGNFSQNFIKNRQVFSNLNRVYQDIKNHQK